MSTVAESTRVACPDCLRDDVMPSMPQGKIENFLFSAFRIYRFRCRACLNRFALRKVGRLYVPLLRAAHEVRWALSISVIAVSLVLMAVMAVKAGHSVSAARGESVAPAPAVSNADSAFVPDASPEKRAHAAFLDNFQAGAAKKTAPATQPK
jgi:hypothetical protein